MAAGSNVILDSCYEHVPYRLDSGHKLGEPPSDEVSGNDNEIWEYGSKSGVSVSDRLGTVDGCVMCALQDALFLGYDCLLVEDYAGTTSPDFCRVATYDNIETDGFRASIASHRDRYDSPAS